MTNKRQLNTLGIDTWRLCDELTAWQASLLMLDANPVFFPIIEDTSFDLPSGFEGVYNALKIAIQRKDIETKIILATVRRRTLDKEGCEAYETVETDYPDWEKSMLDVSSLKKWLIRKGTTNGFFFPEKIEGVADYLNPGHACYPPKLAAAIKAWEAVTADPALLKNKSPKQAIEKWLRENAVKYGLTDGDGNHVKESIEQICKVANWKPSGGANKTAGS